MTGAILNGNHRSTRSPARHPRGLRCSAWIVAIACLCALGVSACGSGGISANREVLVFSAASLRDLLTEIGDAFEADTGIRVTPNFAGSNTLAQQITAAPRADVFLSASEKWMDFVADKGRVVGGSRRTILSNRLVVIVSRSSEISIASAQELATADYEHLSLADPAAVPAGQYTKTWLETATTPGGTLWDEVKDRVAPAPHVRAALNLVEADNDIVGIVYATDAAASERVRVVFEVPADEAPPIRYAMARIEGGANPDAAESFLRYLESDVARAVIEKHGFEPASRPPGSPHE